MTSGIETYGWNEHWQAVWDAGGAGYEGLSPARVTAHRREKWEVAGPSGVAVAELTGKFRREQPEDAHPEVGDFVGVREGRGLALIAAMLPRQSALMRHRPYTVAERQVLAANVDTAFAAMALDRDYNPARLERYLVTMLESGVRPVALLTKADLCPNCWAKVYHLTDRFPDLDVVPVSAVTGEGLEDVRSRLVPGQTAVIMGSSGVGKSTLLNALFGCEVMRTGALRSDGFRGAHTTTYRQMVALPNGALMIDTPGMRELGVVGGGDGLDGAFLDIAELASACRFRDCRHEREPGCAVRRALEDGSLDGKRLRNYRSLQKEMERERARAEYRMKHIRRQEGKPRDGDRPAMDTDW